MMIIISPAKRQNLDCDNHSTAMPAYLAKTKEIIAVMAGFSIDELAKRLNVSQAIAEEAYRQYQVLVAGLDENKVVAAINLYQGDVFKHLNVADMTNEDLAFLQDNLRILSALYGVVKPFDGIWPYRLEMGTPVFTESLAKYWQPVGLERLETEKPKFIFNLASQQYAEMIPRLAGVQWIDIVFQDKDKSGQYKVVAVKAKRMRGEMLRYMIQQRITHPEDLLAFKHDQYAFSEAASSPSRLVFRSR